MIARSFESSDIERFRQIHASSRLDYRFPDLESPLFFVKTVIERDGEPTTLLAGRVEVESYLITSGRPRERWEDIQAAQAVFLEELWKQGIDSTYCAVPPEVDRHFAKRMKSLGWHKPRPWPLYVRDTL